MATLTWRDVAAPDLRGAMQGYENFSQTLNNAINTARSTAQGIDNSITDRVNSELMLKLAAIDDPTKARTATQDLLLNGGVDPRRIRASTLAAAEGLEAKVIGETQARNAFTRAEDRYNLFTKNGDLINAFNIASMRDDQEGATKAAAALMAAGFRSEDLSGILKGGMDFTKGGLDITGSRQDIKFDANREGRDAERFGWDRTQFQNELSDRADQIEAEDHLADILLSAGGDPEMIKHEVAKRQGSFKGKRTSAFLMSRINEQMGGNLFTADTISAAGGGGGGSYDSDFDIGQQQTTVAQTLKAGGLSDAVVAGFLGNFHVEGGYGGAKGDGGTAAGIAQWRHERRDNFKKMFGIDPSKATMEQQAKFVLWEINNPKQAGMTDAQAKAIRNAKTPGEAAALIDKFYERSNGKHRDRRVAAANKAHGLLSPAQVAQNTNRTMANVGAGVAQRDPSGTSQKFLAANGSTMSKSEAAKKLQAALPGSTFNQALSLIDQGMARGKINPEQAFIIYSDNIRPAEGFWRANAPTWLGGDKTGNIGDVSINDKQIGLILDQAARGTYAVRGADGMRQGAAIESLAAARASYEAATARYQKAVRSFQLGLMTEANLAVIQQDMVRAGQNVMMLDEAIKGDPSIGSRNLGTPTPAEIAANVRARGGATRSGGAGRPSYMIGQ